jgi:hypothetical protein
MRKTVFFAVGALSLLFTPTAVQTPAFAADLPESYQQASVQSCQGRENVILFDEDGHPTIPARTPYFYCATGTTLTPDEIPPPREYCCS